LEGGWINAGYGPYSIEDKWTDENGNIWYKIEYVTGAFEILYDLIKISDSNKTMEIMHGRVGYATEIDPESVKYRIYYRQE
jgi:hypothetical protein